MADQNSLFVTKLENENTCEKDMNTLNCLLHTLPEEPNLELNYNNKHEENSKQESNVSISLQKENETLRRKLNEEQERSARYQKKVNYIQEHADILNRLKQAYMSMKYNESAARALIEVKEVSSQTTPTMALKKKDLDAVKESVNTLKQYIDDRPYVNILKDEREVKYRKYILTLFQEKIKLQELIQEKQKELDKVNKQLLEKYIPKECNILKKIIAKLNIKLRNSGTSVESTLKLSDIENKITDHLTTKYETKLEFKKQIDKKITTSVPSEVANIAQNQLNIQTVEEKLEFNSKLA